MIPVNVMRTWTQNVIATFHSHAKPPQEVSDEVDNFGAYLKTLPDHIQWLLMHIKFVLQGEDILKHCLKNEKPLKIRKDGSLNLWKETASFG